MSAAEEIDDSQYSDATWFTAHERRKDPHEYLIPLADEMRLNQSTLHDNTRKCMAIFQWGGDARNLDDSSDPVLEETCNAFNAAQNVIETVHAKVCKSRIIPMPLTSGGGYLARHRAKECGKALEGEFEDNLVDEVVDDVVMDALTTAHGAGAAKVFSSGGRVRIEHVPIEDVWFDAAETRYRKPRCCYHVQTADKFVVLAKYGGDAPELYGSKVERREAILRSGTRPNDGRYAMSTHGSRFRITVYEAWHLPSGDVEECETEDGETAKPTHDGRHTVAIDGCTLIDEPWDGERFPIMFYVPRKRRRSVWGLSMMFDLVAPQREFEKVTAKIQSAHQKMGMSGWLAPKSANLNHRELVSGTTAQGFVAEYDGQVPPTQCTPEPVSPGTYQYKESIPRDMMQHKGVSTLSASSQLPSGMGDASGKALQVFEDFEAERLLPYHRERERFTVGLAWLVIEEVRRLVESDKDYSVRYRGKHGHERMVWAKVLLDREDLILRVFPVSQLSKQPSAKFAQLTELLNAQAITVEQFKRLYEIPDLEAESELDTADTDIIDRNMDIMVTTGRYLSPEPFDNLDLIIQRAGKFINLCRAQEVPEPRLKLLHTYVDDARGIKDQLAEAERKKQAEANAAAAAANPAIPPPMGGPPGAPMPPPPPPPMPVAA